MITNFSVRPKIVRPLLHKARTRSLPEKLSTYSELRTKANFLSKHTMLLRVCYCPRLGCACLLLLALCARQPIVPLLPLVDSNSSTSRRLALSTSLTLTGPRFPTLSPQWQLIQVFFRNRVRAFLLELLTRYDTN